MGLFILRRLGVMLLTALCLTFVVFFLTNLAPNLEKLAKTQGNARMSDAEVTQWLDNRGYGRPLVVRYGEWLGLVPGWTREAPNGTLTGRCFGPADDPADPPLPTTYTVSLSGSSITLNHGADTDILVDQVSSFTLAYYDTYDAVAQSSWAATRKVIQFTIVLNGPDNTTLSFATRVRPRNL